MIGNIMTASSVDWRCHSGVLRTCGPQYIRHQSTMYHVASSRHIQSTCSTSMLNKKLCYGRGTARCACQYRPESRTYRVALFAWSYV